MHPTTSNHASSGRARDDDAWIYLAAVSERPSARLWDLVDEVGPVGAAERVARGEVSEAIERQTRARRGQVDLAAIAEASRAAGARVLTPEHDQWPADALAGLDIPRERARREGRPPPPAEVSLRPFALWWAGPAEPDVVAARAVAVVGTRSPTSYGKVVTGEIAETAVAHGMPVVSGGAFGIDASAHRVALGVGGLTIANLACGIDVPYPRAHAAMLAEIARTGAVVSAYPPGTSVTRFRFLDRNRLIAALTRATVVVEAGVRSGALSTAAWARNLGRPVVGVPGPITSPVSLGVHSLLRDQGALLLRRPAELVEIVGQVGELAEEPRGAQDGWDALDDEARRVLEAVPIKKGVPAGDIIRESGIDAARVRVHLGRFLADGVVARTQAGWVRRADVGTQLRLV